MSTEQESLDRNKLQEAVDSKQGIAVSSPDDLIVSIAASMVANNHYLSKIRGEVMAKHPDNHNPIILNGIIGQQLGYEASAIYEGIIAGMTVYKFVSSLPDNPTEPSIASSPATSLRSVDS